MQSLLKQLFAQCSSTIFPCQCSAASLGGFCFSFGELIPTDLLLLLRYPFSKTNFSLSSWVQDVTITNLCVPCSFAQAPPEKLQVLNSIKENSRADTTNIWTTISVTKAFIPIPQDTKPHQIPTAQANTVRPEALKIFN